MPFPFRFKLCWTSHHKDLRTIPKPPSQMSSPSPQASDSSSSSGSSSSSTPSADSQAVAVQAPVPVAVPDAAANMQSIVDELETADADNCKRKVYLVTLSRVLPETLEATDLRDISDMSRDDVATCLRKAFDDPAKAPRSAGRPRQEEEDREDEGEQAGHVVKKIVVFKELHLSGEVHFHVALLLFRSMRFKLAKDTLRSRDKLSTHWSLTHTQWWSAVRYGAHPSERKPVVDSEPFQWTHDGTVLDLDDEKEQPFTSAAWRKRRLQHEKDVSAGKAKTCHSFSKMDLTSVILEKGLNTRAALLEYVQNHGSASMQTFVHKAQRKLAEYMEDAQEWGNARAAAAAERETDWAVLCRASEGDCLHGRACPYLKASEQIFAANSDSLDRNGLAEALRAIIINGPSKTTRVPLIEGPTNTGKSTLVLPFDRLFGFKKVFHKPALNSKFALRNILKDKRFLFWDDYRPVEYGAETVPTATFLSLFTGSPFEVACSQSFNDGNVDFEWRHGCVMTAKEKDLWTPSRHVSAEDVEHMQSRVRIFACRAKVPRLQDTDACPKCMAKWIVAGAVAHDASQAMRPSLRASLPNVAVAGHSNAETVANSTAEVVCGFEELSRKARVPGSALRTILGELVTLGAVDVRELNASDWTQLIGWSCLKPLEQRRWLSCAQELC